MEAKVEAVGARVLNGVVRIMWMFRHRVWVAVVTVMRLRTWIIVRRGRVVADVTIFS